MTQATPSQRTFVFGGTSTTKSEHILREAERRGNTVIRIDAATVTDELLGDTEA